MNFQVLTKSLGERGSSAVIATGYGLDGPGIETRWGEIFRTCPGRSWGPASLLYNGDRVFPGGKATLYRLYYYKSTERLDELCVLSDVASV
jgi:hypothetical protein